MFTAHNVRLNDGTLTKPDTPFDMSKCPEFKSAKRVLSLVFPDGLKGKSIVDLGCLEGGYTAEFARLGMNALGIEVRKVNYDNCMLVKNGVDLPNLTFAHDTVWNVAKYGPFDAVFCCGLLYHLDRPREFLRLMSGLCKKVMFLHTHFAMEQDNKRWTLSPMTENEGFKGRWFSEHNGPPLEQLENCKWASWENQKSFWMTRASILQALSENEFDTVLEQYDWLAEPSIAPCIEAAMTGGVYDRDWRSMFIGIKTGIK